MRADRSNERPISKDRVQPRTEIPSMTPGDWIIRTGNGEMLVRIAGDSTLALQERPFDCIRITGIRPGGEIEAMGLRNGDLLLAVDSQRFEDVNELSRQASASYSNERTTWTIKREGISHPVSLPGIRIGELRRATGAERESLRFEWAVDH
jgi:membrane-associated protease RseP (regulator of RpoE activity)